MDKEGQTDYKRGVRMVILCLLQVMKLTLMWLGQDQSFSDSSSNKPVIRFSVRANRMVYLNQAHFFRDNNSNVHTRIPPPAGVCTGDEVAL